MDRPKTYEIKSVAGQIEFATYDDNALVNCTDVDSDACDQYPIVAVSVYFNDVWRYNLGCEREDDAGCRNEDAWQLVDSGAPSGGCLMLDGVAS